MCELSLTRAEASKLFLKGKYLLQVNLFGSAGSVIYVAATQLNHCSMEVAVDNPETNGRGHAPIKLYLQNTWLNLSQGLSFANPCSQSQYKFCQSKNFCLF